MYIYRASCVHVGSGTSRPINPEQRLTRNKITFNGGHLNAGGQPLDVGVIDRELKDTVATFDINSGYSLLTVGSSTTNGGSTR